MPREIRPVTAAILNFKMAASSHILPLQLVISLQLLSLKVLKPPNSINENFKISNYEKKKTRNFQRWRLFSKWPPLNYLKFSTHSTESVIKHAVLIRMKDLH